MEKGQVLFLNEHEIEQLITREDALNLVDGALKDYANGHVINPVKLSLPLYQDVSGYINSMPSYNRANKATGVKLVSVYLDNPRNHGLLSTLGTIVLHDWETGMPYSIMGGTHITNIRTGAAAGLKAKYLARKDSRVLALIGAGMQGFSALQMVMLALNDRRIEEIHICDLTEERRQQFISKAAPLYPGVRFVSSPSNQEAMAQADIALFCAGASVPLLESCPVKEGATVICVQELVTPATVAKFDKFFTDFTDCVLERFNSFGNHYSEITGIPYEDLTADLVTSEIGYVMAGLLPGRVSDQERILTLDCGMSIEDIACARFVYDRAVEQGIGTVLDFQNL